MSKSKAKSIIIEGVDGSGKSTLAIRLNTAIRWPIFHQGGCPISIQEDMTRIEKSISVMIGENMIMDRAGFISAAMYGPILWDNPVGSQIAALKIIKRNRPTIFYCRPHLSDHQSIVDRHAVKRYDNAEYVSKISQNAGYLVCQYDRFMRLASNLTNVIHVSESIYGK